MSGGVQDEWWSAGWQEEDWIGVRSENEKLRFGRYGCNKDDMVRGGMRQDVKRWTN